MTITDTFSEAGFLELNYNYNSNFSPAITIDRVVARMVAIVAC